MSKSIILQNDNYWDSKGIVHNKIKLSDLLNRYVVNSGNYIETPNVDYNITYSSGTYKQQKVTMNSLWSGYTSIDKDRYFRIRVKYIQDSASDVPWRNIVIGRVSDKDSWSKRLYFDEKYVSSSGEYSIYEKVEKYSATDGMNDFLIFIWESVPCGCNIKYIEFNEVIPLGEQANDFVTNVVDDLENYYKKSEIDSMISSIPKFAIEVVDELPTKNISDTTIYLLKTSEESQNLYEEYIYVNGWEKLGVQKVTEADIQSNIGLSIVNGLMCITYNEEV
jgi:hypothetical protein